MAARLSLGEREEIAEDREVRMPHFFGYALIAMAIMAPVLVATTFVFFGPG